LEICFHKRQISFLAVKAVKCKCGIKLWGKRIGSVELESVNCGKKNRAGSRSWTFLRFIIAPPSRYRHHGDWWLLYFMPQ